MMTTYDVIDDHCATAGRSSAVTAPRIADTDVAHLALIRERVLGVIQACAQEWDHPGVRVLDVAPQDHEGASPHFAHANVSTLDIDPASGATFTADLCVTNDDVIPSASFDVVICTEVLEHTLDPFAAVAELRRILKPGGRLYMTTPFNFRIHGPLPDCWRFTEHGLRALFRQFSQVDVSALEDPDRFLMPIQYTTIAIR